MLTLHKQSIEKYLRNGGTIGKLKPQKGIASEDVVCAKCEKLIRRHKNEFIIIDENGKQMFPDRFGSDKCAMNTIAWVRLTVILIEKQLKREQLNSEKAAKKERRLKAFKKSRIKREISKFFSFRGKKGPR